MCKSEDFIDNEHRNDEISISHTAGYELNDRFSKAQESKVDVKEIHQIVHNIHAMKEAVEKDSSGISGMWITVYPESLVFAAT